MAFAFPPRRRSAGLLTLTLALTTLTLAALAALPSPAGACDTDVYAVARERWPRETYNLIWCYQAGGGELEGFRTLLRDAGLNEGLNLYPLPLNMGEPIRLAQDRGLLESLGVAGYPFVALYDAQGELLARFQSLEEARRRLAPPSEDMGVISFGQHPITLDSPAARVVIFFDRTLRVPPAASEQNGEPADAEQPAPAGAVSTGEQAKAWAASIAAEPLAGVKSADVVDIRNPGGEQALVDKLGLRPLPVCVLSDPMGRPVAIMDTLPSTDQLQRMAYSPMRDALLKLLSPIDPPADQPETAMVLLLVLGSDAQANKLAVTATRRAAEQSVQIHQVSVPVLIMDPADPREEYFARQMPRQSGQAEPIVMPIIGNGKAMAPIVAPTTSDEILDQVQLAFHPCGCEVSPRDVGEDLLLGYSGHDWPPFASEALAAATDSGPLVAGVTAIDTRSAMENFGIDLRQWTLIGLIALGAVLLVGGLMLWLKARTRTA